MPVCTCTCVHVCIYAYMHVCICACMHRCMYAYIHICINACMHRCMYAEVRMFLTRMMTASWSWVQVFEQHGDYKLVLRVIWPRKRPQRGADCSPSEDYLCFFEHTKCAMRTKWGRTTPKGPKASQPVLRRTSVFPRQEWEFCCFSNRLATTKKVDRCNRPSTVPPYSLGRDENFGVLATD